MKRTPSRLFSVFAAAALLLAPAPSPAWSLFGSEESDLLEKADADFDAAMQAGREGRVMDQLDGLTRAAYAYGNLAKDYPTFKTDHVKARYQEAVSSLTSLNDRIRSGEIAVPDPDSASRGDGRGFVSLDTERPAEPTDLSSASHGMPELVRTGSAAPTVPEESAPAAAPAPDQPQAPAPEPVRDARLVESVPNPFYVGPADSDAPSASVEVRLAAMDEPEVRDPEEEARMARVFLDMIRSSQATDAVILLEDELEKSAEPPLSFRLLYIRALLQRRNYALAEEEFGKIPPESASDPAVRSLRAATCVARGDLNRAMLELHTLLEEHPSYADAYVNMAYVVFLMDPVGNRSSAIEYYHVALENGAARDTRLEAELGVRIGE